MFPNTISAEPKRNFLTLLGRIAKEYEVDMFAGRPNMDIYSNDVVYNLHGEDGVSLARVILLSTGELSIDRSMTSSRLAEEIQEAYNCAEGM